MNKLSQNSQIDYPENREILSTEIGEDLTQKNLNSLNKSSPPLLRENPSLSGIRQGGYDLSKIRQTGISIHRIASLEKLTLKTGTIFLTRTALEGTDFQRGGHEIQEITGTAASLIADNVRVGLAKSLQNNLSIRLDEYHQLLEQLGGESYLLKYGIQGKITCEQDILRLRKGLNKILISEYGIGIKGTGKTGRWNASAFIFKNKNLLSSEMKNLIKTVYTDTENIAVLRARGGRLTSLQNLVSRRISRYLRQTDTGYGASFIYNIIHRGKTILRAAFYTMQSVSKLGLKMALLSAKASTWAAAKAVKHAPPIIKENPTAKKLVANIKDNKKVVEDFGGKTTSKFRSINDRYLKFRRDPFGVKTHLRNIGQRAGNAAMNHLNKTFLKKPIQIAGRIFRFPNLIRSAIARVFAVFSSLITGVFNFILVGVTFLFFILIIMSMVISFLSIFASMLDFTVQEEEVVKAALTQIEECYEEQLDSIEQLKSKYRNVTISYNDIKDESVYNEMGFHVEETTNSAEILAMATVYFDFDLEAAGPNKVKDYVRKLYNGSHETSIATHVYNYVDDKGNPYTVTDADVTLTTYYFNSLFDCKLRDNFGTISGTEISEQVWNYFRSVGFTEESTAAIMGNLMQESGMDPTKVQGGGSGPAAGITQWENINTQSGRWKDLVDYATSQGKAWTDLKCQLDFILIEMPSQFSAYTGHGVHTYPNGTQTWWPDSITVEQYRSMKDIDTATQIYERVFTRASVPMMEQRINYAYNFYNMYKGIDATSDKAQKIIDTAYEQLGKAYQYGATGPDTFDCSGLVQYCYKAAGITVPRTTEEMLKEGTEVYTPLPGDICYTPGHVGIYIGNNQMIEAQGDGVPICISQVRADKYLRFK